MYLNEEKKVDFPVPPTLKQAIKDIDGAFYKNDEFHFMLYLDDIESITKQSLINGNISANQLNLIFERYGLR